MSVGLRLGLVVAPLAFACGGYTTTTRLVAGELITSTPVAPQAYALYLDATIEEATGRLEIARETYLAATQFEGNSPELWTRIADLSCRLGLPSAEDEFATALGEDRWYAPAWIARSQCELRRGNNERAVTFARLAQISAANDFETTDALATAYEQSRNTRAALRQWIGYTVSSPDDRRGWLRLAAFSERNHAPEWTSFATAARGDVRASTPTTTTPQPTDAIPPVLVSAILRNDIEAARAYATDHSLSQVVVLESALSLGRHPIALEQAKILIAAYPTSGDIRALALLAAARARDEALLDQWQHLPEQLNALGPNGQRALAHLLMERGGLMPTEFATDQSKPMDIAGH